MVRAVSYSAMTFSSGSHTGRVTPRVTVKATSSTVARQREHALDALVEIAAGAWPW